MWGLRNKEIGKFWNWEIGKLGNWRREEWGIGKFWNWEIGKFEGRGGRNWDPAQAGGKLGNWREGGVRDWEILELGNLREMRGKIILICLTWQFYWRQ